MGGRNPVLKDAIASVEVYKNELWESLAPLNRKRENATAVVCDQVIYVVGGSNKESGRWDLLSSIEKYQDGAWTELEVTLPEPMSGVSLVRTGLDSIFMIGGTRERGAYSQNTYHWNTETNEVTSGTPLEDGDAFSSAYYYIDETKIIVIGLLIGVFEYDRVINQWELLRFKC